MNARAILEFEAKNKAWSHAYLFVGGGDQEKTEILAFIANENGCRAEDIIEIRPEAESGKGGEIKVEAMREMIHSISLSTQSSRLVVIDPAEKLNQSSGNILLKSLEEPSSKVIFVLFAGCDAVLPTIRSRCRQYFLNRGSREASAGEYLAKIKAGFSEASTEIERIVKSEEITEYLSELEDYFQRKMENESSAGAAKALGEIIRTRKEIAGNANPRLALEALYLKIKKGIK